MYPPIEINIREFQGIRFLYSHLEEGIELIKKDNIKDIWIWQGGDETRYTVNFDFLNDLDFIETFHFQVNLSKKSDITGIYALSNLRDFRWVIDNTFNLDFSRLTTAESLDIRYYEGIALDKLTNLRRLYLSSVLKTDDLEFLPELESLELLRIISGKFTSLDGLERCKNLKRLDLRGCFKLVYANATLNKLNHLESVTLDSKKHDIDEAELKTRVAHVGLNCTDS